MLPEKIKKFLLWLATPTGLVVATIPALALTYFLMGWRVTVLFTAVLAGAGIADFIVSKIDKTLSERIAEKLNEQPKRTILWFLFIVIYLFVVVLGLHFVGVAIDIASRG